MLRDARRTNGAFRVVIPTESGVSCVLEFKTTIESPSWTPLQTFIGQGTLAELSDPNPTTEQRFYRVRAQ